jgi:hypothetical protein
MNFTYDDTTHIYKLDNKRLLSVNNILDYAGLQDYSKIPMGLRESIFAKGKAVHKAVYLYSKGSLNMDTLSPEIRPYVEQWQLAVERFEIEVLFAEEPMYHPKYLYAGTPDIVCKYMGNTVVLDIKTFAELKFWVKYQLAGYKAMIEETKGLKLDYRLAIQLSEHMARPIRFIDDVDFYDFLAFKRTAEIRLKEGLVK